MPVPCVVAAVLAAVLVSRPPAAPPRQTETFTGCFDTAALLIGYGRGFTADAARVRARAEELHHLLDIYNDYEGVTNAKTVNDNAGAAPVAVPRELYEVIETGVAWHGRTAGKFNIALGPVPRLWKECAARGEGRPGPDELAAALALCDIRDVILDPERQTVFLAKPGMSLDLGAVAKGYASRLAVEEAEGAMLLNLGGNVAVNGPPADGRAAWNIGVAHPDRPNDPSQSLISVAASGGAVVTSGDYQRYHYDDGQRLGHIIDPDTARPGALYRSVTVAGPDAAICDILSTALFLLPREEGMKLAGEAGYRAIWVLPDLSIADTETERTMDHQ
ncbi:MAG: FAD:protein FMN transferase [Oscillospiraceae bacterium]|nr:FAD:protein FMN transferase [Oscillospiraceae bacterium]